MTGNRPSYPLIISAYKFPTNGAEVLAGHAQRRLKAVLLRRRKGLVLRRMRRVRQLWRVGDDLLARQPTLCALHVEALEQQRVERVFVVRRLCSAAAALCTDRTRRVRGRVTLLLRGVAVVRRIAVLGVVGR